MIDNDCFHGDMSVTWQPVTKSRAQSIVEHVTPTERGPVTIYKYNEQWR